MGFKAREKQNLRKEIEKIFKDLSSVSSFELNSTKRELKFCLEAIAGYGEACTYGQLKKLSELLNTDQIGFEGDFEHGYYDVIDKNVTIYCKGVNFSKVPKATVKER